MNRNVHEKTRHEQRAKSFCDTAVVLNFKITYQFVDAVTVFLEAEDHLNHKDNVIFTFVPSSIVERTAQFLSQF